MVCITSSRVPSRGTITKKGEHGSTTTSTTTEKIPIVRNIINTTCPLEVAVESRRSAVGVPDIIILTIQTLSSPIQQQAFITKAENVRRFSDNTISLTTERIQGRTAIQMKK